MKKIITLALTTTLCGAGLFLTSCKGGSNTPDTPSTVEVKEIKVTPTEKALHVGQKAELTATVSPENATDKQLIWQSSDNKVATVSNGTVTAVSEGKAIITASTAKGVKSNACTITVTKDAKAVQKITLKENTLTLEEEQTHQLVAQIEPEDAPNKEVTWASSDANIAKVDNNGLVTAVKAGKAIITVTTKDGNKIATCQVTVTAKVINVTGVTLSDTSKKVTEGESFTLTATVTPANATNKQLTWSSSDATIAMVDVNGKVTALKAGKATITVTTKDGNKTATCEVTVEAKVTDIAVTGVALDLGEKKLKVGDSFTLTAVVNPANATNKQVTWSSSDATIAKVDVNGKVTALKAGKATITVTTKDGNKTAKCEVTVEARPEGGSIGDVPGEDF